MLAVRASPARVLTVGSAEHRALRLQVYHVPRGHRDRRFSRDRSDQVAALL